jgi:glutathione S-transferase
MPSNRHITLFHSPQTRSTAALLLLEELQADYELHVLNMKAGEQRQPAYLAVNPLGKVPAILHGGTLVTEQVAIFIYLADLYAEAGLAPALTDPQRGAYLRWLVFYGSCFEPAMMDRAAQREVTSPMSSAYGRYEDTVKLVHDQLSGGPYFLGERFSAADLLWGMALSWMLDFKLLEAKPVFTAYVERFSARPVVARTMAAESALAAQHAAAVAQPAASATAT